ncbi:MAG: DUF4410 domain-containing protein [Xanthobacteraceae bacterium]
MRRAISGLVFALFLGACGQTGIQNMSSMFVSGLARPEMIVVSDLEISPNVVLLDKGFAAQIQRRLGKLPPEQMREQLAARVNQEIVVSMVMTLTEDGFAAREGGKETTLTDKPVLLVSGKVRAIDQGNRTRRAVIGLGAGKSEVAADIAVSHVSPSGKKEVLAFAAEAESGMRPGAAVTAPVSAPRGAATVAAAAAGGAISEKLSADVEAHARRLGQAAARRIIAYAAEQGWTAQPAAQDSAALRREAQ